MKRFLFAVLVSVMAVSCYDDSSLVERMDNYEHRLTELETACNRMNGNISSLQTVVEALQSDDGITGFTPVYEGDVEVGYKIRFRKGGEITIHHGRTGAAGDAGVAPVIGVKQEGGIYYWTVDGDWVTDAAGDKIAASGGTMPKFMVEGGVWYVSYDNGTSWEKIGESVAQGSDNVFTEVVLNDGYVTFTLVDGTTFRLPKLEDGVRSYYLDEIAKTKASLYKLMNEPCLVFPMIADIHYKASKDCPDLIDITVDNMVALSKDIRFDFIACLGDIVEGDRTQAETESLVDHLYDQFMRIDAPYYPAIGNHDENWEHGAFSHQQLHRIYMRNTLDVMFDQTSMCGTNFYKDFYGLGVRCIFLNSINGGTFGFSEATCGWFEEALDTSFDVYVFSHVSPIRAHQHDYWYHYNDDRIAEAIKAAPNFKMFFNGHSHFDCEFTAPFNTDKAAGRNYNPFLAYSLTCNKFVNNTPGKNWPAHAVQPFRELGTVTEDAFDIVVIRPKSGKVNTVRFGAGVDREFDLFTGQSMGESAAANFPDEITVTLDFSAGWPFEEECAVNEEQRAGGEFYRYLYDYTRKDGVAGIIDMRFGLQRSSAKKTDANVINYSFADGALSFADTAGDATGGTYGMINVPGVPGRYVTSIEITHDKSAMFTIADGERFVYDASPNASSSSSAGPTVFKLPYVKGEKTVPAGLGASYNIRMRTADVGISRITVRYSTKNSE